MNYYGKYTIKKYENPPRWESPDENKKNLLLGLPVYGVLTDGTINGNHATEYYNSKEGLAGLTDGKKALSAVYTDPAYVHFTRGAGRTLAFKLGGLSAIYEVKISFLREDYVGIRLPRRCDVLVSENGETWHRVLNAKKLTTNQDPVKYELSQVFENPYKALYVVVRFEVPGHVWIDEIEAIGTEKIPENAVSGIGEDIEKEYAVAHVNKYPDYDDFLGVRNLLLSYNCVPPEKVGENGLGLITEEQYLPHLVYMDGEGKAADTFFDAFLYLPYSVYTYSYLYKCADGWKYYVDNLFTKDKNLDALSKAAKKAGDLLGIADYKVKVFFSILSTKVHYGEFPEKFGDLDGDGVDEDMESFEGRKKALKWIIDTQIEKYNSGGYGNTILGGFYWFEEDIHYNDEHELDLIAFVRKYLRSLGLKFFWIPYFQAWGFQEWKENGFDLACMQPNYAFSKDITVDRLYENATLTKQLGMCVELEIGGLKPENIEKYKCYLDVGEETGYMNTVKMYYQGGVPGEFYHAFKSDDPLVRSVYDDTYLFAKGKYVSRNKR